MDSVQERLLKLEQAIAKAMALRSRAEGQAEQLEPERERLLAEMQALGVTPETIDQRIAELEAERDEALAKAESLIPWDLIENDGKVVTSEDDALF